MDLKNVGDVISIIASILSIAAVIISVTALRTVKKSKAVLGDGNIVPDIDGSDNTLIINIDRKISEVDNHLKEKEKEAREMNDVDREKIIHLLNSRLVRLKTAFQEIKALGYSPMDEKYRVVLDGISQIEFEIKRLSNNS